jgi:uncharacterized protein YbaR (Trm112 family)
MFIELVDVLRCTRAHELTWLVASAYAIEDRDIVRGLLGCPTCGARYPIEHGIADFRGAPEGTPPPAHPSPSALGEPDLGLRVAAFLDLMEPGGFVVLAGSWSAAAPSLVETVERLHVLAIDPVAGLESGGGVSLAYAADRLPLRPATARGVALDDAHAGPEWLASAAEAVRPGGRLLAPAAATVPAGFTELARDANQWVAVKAARPEPMVPLTRPRTTSR